jgi:hypothetical protein
MTERYFADKRYELTTRHVLSTDPQRYDFIEAGPIPPDVSNSGFLYSVEYFRQLRSRLSSGGLCTQWSSTPRIRNTFAVAFPYALDVLVTNLHVIIGSERPIDFNTNAMVERLLDSDTRAYLADAQWDADVIAQLFRERQVIVSKHPDDARDTDINTDLFPKDEFQTLGWLRVKSALKSLLGR